MPVTHHYSMFVRCSLVSSRPSCSFGILLSVTDVNAMADQSDGHNLKVLFTDFPIVSFCCCNVLNEQNHGLLTVLVSTLWIMIL